ncbi:TPA: glycosyltransferase family 2 protein, partial [Escherichia coli]|nr:glycosyltransferase family 2 protein [Escherichia coli]
MTVEYNRDELLTHFDEQWYLQTYRDVSQTGLPAREHFKRYGRLLGRKPCADGVSSVQKPAVHLPWVALNQLSADPERMHGWKSEGNDPYFILDLGHLPKTEKGWYQFNLTLECPTKQGLAKFYLDNGKGFNEFETVTLPYKKAVTASRLFYLDSPLVALRFDPLEQEGSFS